MPSAISLEYYPKLPKELLTDAILRIRTNRDHWESPFFMDVYKHAELKEIIEVCRPFMEDPKLKNVIVLGTGGSYQTLKGLDLFADKNLFFLPSSRPYELSLILESTSPEDSIVIPISRGGKTIDVNSVVELFKDYRMLALSSRGPMNELVKELDVPILPVPDLSGRFAASVCSVVFAPALIAGINIDEFMRGMNDAYEVYKNLNNVKLNTPLQYATFLEQLYLKGYRNVFSMPYSKWLEGIVGLFVQEISESSGKENKGMMGTYQAAPLCQHSVLELILGGSKGFVSPLLWTTLTEPTDVILEGKYSGLNDQTGLSVINYQLDATFQAILEQEIPAAKISLEKISPYHFGQLVAFIQTTVYYFSLLLDVNWSSNPMVNIGKKICNEAIADKLDFEARIQARKDVAKTRFANFYSNS
ncbi:MAG: hypothetical protein ACTSVU_00530 [Promethearchaeota archaeon]